MHQKLMDLLINKKSPRHAPGALAYLSLEVDILGIRQQDEIIYRRQVRPDT